MSKLKNAPLIEVVFELRWNISNQKINEFQYLIGDMNSILKEEFSYRETLIPQGIPFDILKNQPCYRFRKIKDGYPLYQLGPGMISYNTIDEIYDWDNFYIGAKNVFDSFSSLYDPIDVEQFFAGLIYFDFYPFDFISNDINKFLNDKFNISFSESFLKDIDYKPNDVNLSFNYQLELGNLIVSFKRGNNNKSEDGIIVETRINSYEFVLGNGEILSWLIRSHDFTSQLFKDLVKKDFFETFK